MMKQSCFLLLLCLSSLFALGQRTSGKKALYAEAFGNGVLASLNYDLRLNPGQPFGGGFRVGLGGFPLKNYNGSGEREKTAVLSLPLGYNYIMGKRRHTFEVGAGLTPIYVSAPVIEDSLLGTLDKGLELAGFLNAGYRLQPLRTGAVVRLMWTPAITGGGVNPLWFGASLGFGF